jgi:hypothetical protein
MTIATPSGANEPSIRPRPPTWTIIDRRQTIAAVLPYTSEICRSDASFHWIIALADLLSLRFAVGTFAAWQQLSETLQDVRLRGLSPGRFSCLALRRVFTGNIRISPFHEPVGVQMLAFPNNREPIGCTYGQLAACLGERLRSGVPSLKDALGHWLVPRHAAYFQEAVDGGNILLWIQVATADEERRAGFSLLANSSNSVGVHDLIVPPSS